MGRWERYDLLTFEWLVIGTGCVVLLALLTVWSDASEVKIRSPWDS